MTGVGLVGVGNWGANWLRTLATLPDADLRWVCDLNPALLAKISADLPKVRTTRSLDDLLRDPEMQGIVIASIAPTHFVLARRALEAGKDVMVEKPMALTTADAAELARLADENDRVLMVGHLMEYHPAIRTVRGLIDSGELGEIRRIESRRSNHGILRTDENVWWSLAPHDISMAVRLMGDWPTTVLCEGQNIVQKHIADVVGGTLRFPGGRIARIDVSWHDPAKVRELKLYGSKKWAVFNDMLPWDRKVIVYDRGFDVDAAGKIATRRGGETPLPLDQTEPLVAEARHFIECVRTRSRPISDGRSGTGIVAILEAGQTSLEAGREVPVTAPTAGLRIAGTVSPTRITLPNSLHSTTGVLRMEIRQAVITAAGRGHRTLPLQTLVDRTGTERKALEIILAEAVEAGVDEVCVVVTPGDQAAYREAAGPHARRLHFVEQTEPTGYGQALSLAREFVAGRPFLHLVSDHVYLSDAPETCAKQVIEAARAGACSVSAVQATRESFLPYYGAVGGRRVGRRTDLYEVDTILEKPTPSEAEQRLIVPGLRAGYYLCLFGIHAFTPAVMDMLVERIAAEGPKAGLSPVLADLARRERYLALELRGRRYNTGVKYGLLYAQLALALGGSDREDVLAGLVELLAQDRRPR